MNCGTGEYENAEGNCVLDCGAGFTANDDTVTCDS